MERRTSTLMTMRETATTVDKDHALEREGENIGIDFDDGRGLGFLLLLESLTLLGAEGPVPRGGVVDEEGAVDGSLLRETLLFFGVAALELDREEATSILRAHSSQTLLTFPCVKGSLLCLEEQA